MANIQVSWLKDVCVATLTPELLEQCSGSYMIALEMRACELTGFDDEHFILEFSPTPGTDLLSVTRQIVEDIRCQAHCMSGFGDVGAHREYVSSEEGDDAVIVQMNEALAALDEALDDLKRSEQRRSIMKESVEQLAQDLKRTRSIFGNKAIASVRRSLESMTR